MNLNEFSMYGSTELGTLFYFSIKLEMGLPFYVVTRDMQLRSIATYRLLYVQSEYLIHFSDIFKASSVGPTPGIKTVTSSSAGSALWTGHFLCIVSFTVCTDLKVQDRNHLLIGYHQ